MMNRIAVKHISLIVAGALMASAVASCGNAAPVETETAVPESVPSVEASVSESETTEEETVYTGFSVETEPHENPFGDFASDVAYSSLTFNLIFDDGKFGYNCGFDNSYSVYMLQQAVYEETGVLDTSITLSDVNYFQNFQGQNDMFGGGYKFSEAEDWTMFNSFRIEAVRAVLSSLGLRFGIDEIPASYLEERFPRLFYDYLNYNNMSRAVESGEVEALGVDEFYALKEVEDPNYLDMLIFNACTFYNFLRMSDYVYGNPYGYGCITQVRDASTGKNVLVPTDAQAEAMQEDINCIPGCENISIYVPETAEEFYASYGYYPDDLISNVGSINTPEAFEEYYNSLPEDEQFPACAPILFD